MTTFQQWLAKQEDGPQDDPVAWLARAWKSQEGKRPRVSSASGIEKHMLTLGSGDEAAQDNWTGYVHQATGEATGRFKADQLAGQTAKQAASGSDTSSGETQAELPGIAPQGINEATGKPVAIVTSAQWRTYPDASQYGSCGTCSWPRGLADLGQGRGELIMCAAGHVFAPAKPGPAGSPADADQLAAVQAGEMTPAEHLAANEVAAEAAEPGQEAVVTLSGPLTPVAGPGGAGTPVQGQEEPPEPMTQLDRIELMLAAVVAAIGLPPDLGILAEYVQTPWGPPPDFAAWYGQADPNATAGE